MKQQAHIERLEAALKERMEREPEPKPYRFSIPLSDQTITVKVEDVQSALTDIKEMQALLDEAREGLDYYACVDHYDTRGRQMPVVMDDKGQRARALLNKLGETV